MIVQAFSKSPGPGTVCGLQKMVGVQQCQGHTKRSHPHHTHVIEATPEKVLIKDHSIKHLLSCPRFSSDYVVVCFGCWVRLDHQVVDPFAPVLHCLLRLDPCML